MMRAALLATVLRLVLAQISRKKGFLDGDIIIGALFPIHEAPTHQGSFSRQCGRVREQYGMHRVEVLLQTIERVNRDPSLLPGLTLGVDIRDSCWFAPIALEQSIDFIRNSIALHEQMEQDSSPLHAGFKVESSAAVATQKTGEEKAIAALIGPASSAVSIQVQNLLQLFKIPQVGYSATTIDLSRKQEYKFFLRVVPSDLLQAKAIRDLIQHYGWTFVSLVNSKGNYGLQGKNKLREYLKDEDDEKTAHSRGEKGEQRRRVCVDKDLELDKNWERAEFEKKANSLFEGERPARVIVCFCEGETVTELLRAMARLGRVGAGFLLIGTDGWADRTEILGSLMEQKVNKRDLSEAARGSLTIRLHSPRLTEFDAVFRSKTGMYNSEGNPWWREFWEQKFGCSIERGHQTRQCTGKESLWQEEFSQDAKLGFVVKSVMTVAYGLHKLSQKSCYSNNIRKACRSLKEFVNGTELLAEMMNVNFTAYDKQTVWFNEYGDPPGRYDIMNYRLLSPTRGYGYELVGEWKDNLKMKMSATIEWPLRNNSTTSNLQIESDCSQSCAQGQARIFSSKCCWSCHSCENNEIVQKNSNNSRNNPEDDKCQPCKNGSKPLRHNNTCVEFPPEFLHWKAPQCLIAAIFACCGLLATFFTASVLVRHRNTPVVKAASRELMFVILAGTTLSYLSTFLLISYPTQVRCILAGSMPAISFSLVFGALVTKTNRIFRILATSKKKIIRRRGRFLSTPAQLVITALLNAVECILIVVVMSFFPPIPTKTFLSWNKAMLKCNMNNWVIFVPLGFDAILVLLCTWYAFKTRNLPENFNEAKFIGFTMYTTCIIWMALVPIYFGATDYQTVSLCYAVNLSASVSLVLLFAPKLHIILLRPEKNARSAYTTTSDIRCHFGGYQCAPPSQSSSHRGDTAVFREASTLLLANSVHKNSQSLSRGEDMATQTSLEPGLPRSSVAVGLSPGRTALLHFLEHRWDRLDTEPPNPSSATLQGSSGASSSPGGASLSQSFLDYLENRGMTFASEPDNPVSSIKL